MEVNRQIAGTEGTMDIVPVNCMSQIITLYLGFIIKIKFGKM